MIIDLIIDLINHNQPLASRLDLRQNGGEIEEREERRGRRGRRGMRGMRGRKERRRKRGLGREGMEERAWLQRTGTCF